MKKAVGALVLLLILVVSCISRSHAPQAAALVHRPHVLAVPVRRAPVRPTQTISGQAEALRTATVESEVSGRVLHRPHVGDAVRAGDVLLQIDTAVARAELDGAQASAERAWAAFRQAQAEYRRATVETAAGQREARAQLLSAQAAALKLQNGSRPQELRSAEAALEQARADETLARRDASRYRDLLDQGAIPTQVWDQAQDRLANARSRREQAEQSLSLAREGARREDRVGTWAQVDQARAQLEVADTRDLRLATLREQLDGLRAQAVAADATVRQARIAFERHSIRAPFSGRVLAAPVEVGELVAAGTPVVRLGEVRRMKAIFQVPAATRRALHLGQTLSVGSGWRGRITTLGVQADPRTRDFAVELTIDNPQERMLPGTVLSLSISNPAQPRLVVPLGCVATDGTVSYVYVLNGDRVSRRPVHLGDPTGDDVVVTDGLSEGESVASNPQPLTDGAEVETAP